MGFPPAFMKLRMYPSIALMSLALLPLSAYALPGTGPRIDIQGVILQVNITADQKFDNKGGEVILKADNGQTIQIVLLDNVKIITEGRLSRKTAVPSDLRTGMNIRARGIRLGTDSMNASLITITNIEKNPATSANGILQAVSSTSVSIVDAAGVSKTFSIDDGTQVIVDYKVYGSEGLSFIGKQAFLSFSKGNPQLVKIIHISLPENLK